MAVVVPCYNDGATLPAAIASVRLQEPCELVVVDDGSREPETARVLAELQEDGVRLLRQRNAGPAAARMRGVAATSAPYVFPLDADDLLAPGGLAALADALDANPEAAVAWGDVEIFGEERTYWRSVSALDPWWISYANEIPNSSLARRSKLLEVGGWQLRDGWEDWDLWMAFAERGFGGVHVAEKVFCYRVHGSRRQAGSVSRYEEFYGDLRRRHERLFAERASNRRRSCAPLRLRLVFPVIDALPSLTARNRARLYSLVAHPAYLARRLLRLARARRA